MSSSVYKNLTSWEDRLSAYIRLQLSCSETHPVISEMQRQVNSKSVDRIYGIQSMFFSEKEEHVNKNREKTQITPLASLLSSRNGKLKKLFCQDTFIGPLSRRYDYTIAPIRLVDDRNQIQSWTYTKNSNTLCKKGYDLSDCQLILDIDCGEKIDKVVEAFQDFKFAPQTITIEKGLGRSKKGHASAIFYFNSPIDSLTRKLYLRTIREMLSFVYNLYVVDSRCTGIGFSKNPLKLYNEEFQRNYLVLHNSGCIAEAINRERFDVWCRDASAEFEEFKKDFDEVDKKMQNFDWASSSLLFTEQLDILKSVDSTSDCSENDEYFNIVTSGTRNNTLVKELSILALQFYILKGEICPDAQAEEYLYKHSTNSILDRYENSDNEVTEKFIRSRIHWVLEQDRRALQDEGLLLSLVKNCQYQYNIMKKQGYSLLDSDELRFNPSFRPAFLPETPYYTRAQSQRGASTQCMKCLLYSASLFSDKCEYLYKVASREEEASDICIEYMKTAQFESFKHMVRTAEYLSRMPHDYVRTLNIKSENNIKSEQNFNDAVLNNTTRFLDTHTYRSSEYFNEVILYAISEIALWGMSHPKCEFTQIKKNDVESIWKSIYKKFGSDIHTVSCLMNLLRTQDLTGLTFSSYVHNLCIEELSYNLICKEIDNSRNLLDKNYRENAEEHVTEILTSILSRFKSDELQNIFHELKSKVISICKRFGIRWKIVLRALSDFLDTNASSQNFAEFQDKLNFITTSWSANISQTAYQPCTQ